MKCCFSSLTVAVQPTYGVNINSHVCVQLNECLLWCNTSQCITIIAQSRWSAQSSWNIVAGPS